MTLKTPKVASTRLSLPLGVAGAEPADAAVGTLAYATDTDTVRVKTSTGWEDVGSDGGGTITEVDGTNGIVATSPTGPVVSLAPTYGSTANTVTQGNDSRLSDSRTPTGSAGGDLSGTYPNPSVVTSGALKSATTNVVTSAATAPTSGQVLTATSTTAATWQTPSGGSPTGAAGGDLAGTYPNPTVTQARGLLSATTTVSVSAATAPTTGQALVATGASAATWQTLSSSLAIRDPFWDPPTTASPDDDEFTVDTLANGTWSINAGATTNATRDGAVDMSLSALTTGHYRSTVVGSTLFVQFLRTDAITLHKTFSGALSTTQLWFVAYGTVADYSPTQRVVNFTLARNNAGQPDNNNRIIIQPQNSNTRVNNVSVLAGVTTTETGGTSDAGALGMDGLYARVSHGSSLGGNFYGGLWKRNGLHSANVAGALAGPQFNQASDRLVIAWSATAVTGVPYTGAQANGLMALHFVRRMPNTGVWFAQP